MVKKQFEGRMTNDEFQMENERDAFEMLRCGNKMSKIHKPQYTYIYYNMKEGKWQKNSQRKRKKKKKTKNKK